MSQKRKRRKFSAEEKATVLRKHLVEKKPVSDVCDEYGIQPSVFYAWQAQALGNLAEALERRNDRQSATGREQKLARENEALKSKLVRKDNVIAEISEEYVQLKKELGEP